MLIVGERINTSRKVKGEKVIEAAVMARDEAAIARLAQSQREAGSDYIDINAGTLTSGEPEALEWLTGAVMAAVDAPICFDSPNPEALERALAAYDPSRGQPFINSISGERARYDAVLPFVLQYKARVVALANDDSGIQTDAGRRLDAARKLVADLVEAGVPVGDIYVDPLTFPIANAGDAAIGMMSVISTLKAEYPGVQTIAGLSNVSHGLPARKILNSAMTILCMEKGLDAGIIDPNDRYLMALIAATEALLGRDEYCMGYIKKHRAGAFENL